MQGILEKNTDLSIDLKCEEGTDSENNNETCKLVVAVTENLGKSLKDRKYFGKAYALVRKDFKEGKNNIEKKLKEDETTKVQNNLKKWIAKNGGEKNAEKIVKKLWNRAKALENRKQKFLKQYGPEGRETLALKYEIALVRP